MPFDSLAFLPEVPPDLPDEQQGRRIRDILAGWTPRAIAAPRRWSRMAVVRAGLAFIMPLSDKRADPC
jgi:hypothetical protein